MIKDRNLHAHEILTHSPKSLIVTSQILPSQAPTVLSQCLVQKCFSILAHIRNPVKRAIKIFRTNVPKCRSRCFRKVHNSHINNIHQTIQRDPELIIPEYIIQEHKM